MQATREKELEAQFVGFRLGERDFAVDIRRIIEIIYFRAVTPMPEAPEFVEGVVDLRGKIIPILDLRKIIKIPEVEMGDPNHILIIRTQKRMVGVIVDSVQEVLRISLRNLQSPHATLGRKSSPHLKGVYRNNDHLIFILTLEKLLTTEENKRLGLINE